MPANPQPRIIIDGAFLSCAPAVVDGTGEKVFALDRPTLVDDIAISWGRDDQWTQPDPAVVTFRLWEPYPGTWLTKIVNDTAMRRGVNIVYTEPASAGGQYPGDKSMFQGFTTNVDVVWSEQRTVAGRTAGWMVTIQAADRSATLGQATFAAGYVLPEETMQNRAVKIRNQGAPAGIREMYFESRYAGANCKAVATEDKSVLDMVNGMYTSFADQWCYNPGRNTINRIPTGSTWGNYDLKIGKAADSDTLRLYPPPWQDTTGAQSEIDTRQYPPGNLGACKVTGDIALAANTVQSITELTCSWFDKPNNHDWKTTVVAKNDGGPPARLQWESWFNNGTAIDPMMTDVKTMVLGDGRKPMHPQIVWDTRKTGLVPDWSTFERLTTPAQTIGMVTLTGSPFSAATGNPPVWHICGGVIAYRAGYWHFTVNLAPTSMPLDPNRTPITPNTVNQTITLDDPAGRRFEHSVTPYDLYYVSDPNIYPVP